MVTGDFIGPDVVAARRAFSEWLAGGVVSRIIVDLSKTWFLGGQGLEALTFAAAGAQSLRGRVALAGPNDICRKILEMTRLDRRFEVFPNCAEAMKSLRSEGSA